MEITHLAPQYSKLTHQSIHRVRAILKDQNRVIHHAPFTDAKISVNGRPEQYAAQGGVALIHHDSLLSEIPKDT